MDRSHLELHGSERSKHTKHIKNKEERFGIDCGCVGGEIEQRNEGRNACRLPEE